MIEMFKKIPKPPKKTLSDLINDKSLVTGKEVIQKIQEQKERQKEFEESVAIELQNRKNKKSTFLDN